MGSFVPYNGYRLEKEGRSLLVWPLSITKIGALLTDQQLFAYARRIARFVDAMGKLADPPFAIRTPTAFAPPADHSNFTDKRSTPFRKLVSRVTWDRYLSKGGFQLGSAEFYRATEDNLIADKNEGLHCVCVNSADRQAILFGRSGDNCALFCGTQLDASEISPEHRKRFGDVLVEIHNVEAFATGVCEAIGARKFRIHDVIYSDAKTFRVAAHDVDLVVRLLRTREEGRLTESVLESLEEDFESLYEATILPSLFMKPAEYYSLEMERRIAFEFDADLMPPFVRFTAPELLNFCSITELD
jgi:hypothetical protein